MTDWTMSGKDKATSVPLAGERLAEARQAADIPLRDIAKELHLDEQKVSALEENRFDDLGAAVFAKGHLRKYAELVGVSPDDVIADYDQMNQAATPPPVVGRKRPRVRDLSPGSWIAGFLIIVVVAGALYWWLSREPVVSGGSRVVTPAPAVTAPVAVADSESIVIPLEIDATEPVEESPPEQAAEPLEAVADFVEPVAAASDLTDVASVELTLSFSGDCWAEVTDASGRRLFFDLGRDGRNVKVAGAAPLRVLLGNSDNVSVQVDGRDYAISASQRRGNTATLTINSQ